ncbi:MAG TPA: DNA recombination protein RmuC, partial [Rhodocyclaceae bacterium]|nr:DNA recombination protein RmuC [Rhodocyclaceae bacterium]
MTLGLDIAIIAGLGAVIVLQILILQRGAAAGRAGEAALAELVDAQTRALERLERELREELARGRREEAETAFREREEQARSASLLSQTVTTQLTQLGSLQGE